MPCPLCTAPPHMESDLREQNVEKGETLKVKIPFSGTGPFSFKLMKGNREIPDSDRVKLIPFEGYVILQIKGQHRFLLIFYYCDYCAFCDLAAF